MKFKWLALLASGMITANATTTSKEPSVGSSDEFRKLLLASIDRIKGDIDRFSAEVWLVDMTHRLRRLVPHIPEQERLEILTTVFNEAKQADLNPQLVLSLIHVESMFDKYAISSVGARGLMQVMPFWKSIIGKPSDNLLDITTNIRYGCAILNRYLKREEERLTEGLARYNGSVGQYWYPERIFAAWDDHWFVHGE